MSKLIREQICEVKRINNEFEPKILCSATKKTKQKNQKIEKREKKDYK